MANNSQSLVQSTNYTIDTCVFVSMLDTPNLAGLLKCRLGFANSTVFLNPQIVREVEKQGYSYSDLCDIIVNSLGAREVFKEITSEISDHSYDLEELHTTLHSGDSLILACAKSNSSKLITCDKDFLTAAQESGVHCINPNTLHADLENKFTNKFSRAQIKNKIHKITNSVRKTKCPRIEEIVWNSFE